MKKIYSGILLTAISFTAFGQRTTNMNAQIAPIAIQQHTVAVAIDTLSNIEADDTLAIYNSDQWGYAFGHNNYNDQAFAEKYYISGSGQVLGGAYLLFANSIQTTTGMATGKVYSVGANGLPSATALGSANIPYATIPVGGSDLTYFSFTAPVAVADSFFMSFNLTPYTSTQDTIGVISTRDGNRSAGGFGQNAAMWNDNVWYDELTQNWGTMLTYALFPVIDLPAGIGSISKNGFTLFAAYPSPANDNINISYNLSSTSNVTINIFDMAGKLVMSIDNKEQAAGKHNHKLDVSNLASGSYVYSVSSNDNRLYSRFIIAK